jgi:hypothetical protein
MLCCAVLHCGALHCTVLHSPVLQVVELAQHISSKCPSLRLAGLMTIGMPDYSSRPENFTCLQDCRCVCVCVCVCVWGGGGCKEGGISEWMRNVAQKWLIARVCR